MTYDRLDLEVRTFIDAFELAPVAQTTDELFAQQVAFQRDLHQAGLVCPAWPSEYGGRGLAPRDAARVAQLLGDAGMPEIANFVAIEVLAPALLRHARPALLDRWLAPMASADEIWCQLFSEPDAGSDLAALSTRARAVGDGWRITGQKVWSTWAQHAAWGLLLARTGTAESRHRGISVFVVPMNAPGITIRPLRTMTGISEFAEVFFDDTPADSTALVGDVDGGWLVALDILGNERGPYAIRRASTLRAALHGIMGRGRGVAMDLDARDDVARAFTALRLLDLRLEAVIADLEAGHTPGAEAAVTKSLLTAADQAVHAAAFRALGPNAMAWDGCRPEAVGAYLYSRAASIYGGTSQIQRNVIGERLLDLPRGDA